MKKPKIISEVEVTQMEFKDRLIQLRKGTKLYQTDMAKKIGVARATYGAYEQGTRQPDFDTLKKIADYFEVTTDYLLYGTVESETRSIMGNEVDTSNLSENQRLVLDWAMAQDALSFHDMSKADLEDILENLSVIFEYEKNKRNAKKK